MAEKFADKGNAGGSVDGTDKAGRAYREYKGKRYTVIAATVAEQYGKGPLSFGSGDIRYSVWLPRDVQVSLARVIVERVTEAGNEP